MKKVFLVVLSLLLLLNIVFSAPLTKSIKVLYNSVSISIGKDKLKLQNFVYDGKIYVPLQDIAKYINMQLLWDKKNNTALLKEIKIEKKNPIATIEMKSGEKIEIELYPDKAPNTVNNFIYLANKGFYNGLTFHRVVPKFVIQGGCPKGDGSGGPGYSIKGEFLKNGVSNDLLHNRGIISMARTPDPNSGGSQFFITLEDINYLNGEYTAFGKVIKGMETVDKIAAVERGENDKPKTAQIIKSIKVETFGVKYAEPEKYTAAK